jgi:D-sedoheptulose 7-phosphate isomerase
MSETEQSPLARAVSAAFDESARVKREFAAGHAQAMERAARILIDCFSRGGKVLLFGNGGSAADAQHIAAEWEGRFRRERPGLPAIALTANSSNLTAIGNDYGFERVFARLVEAHGRKGDVAIAISTSGNSPNVLAGLDEARVRGMHTLGLAGNDGGKLAGLVDVALVVPSDRTDRIQEVHITALHALCDAVDDALYPETAS